MKKKHYKTLELFLAFLIFLDIIGAFITTYIAVIYIGDWFKSLMFFSLTIICFIIAVLINIVISKLRL